MADSPEYVGSARLPDFHAPPAERRGKSAPFDGLGGKAGERTGMVHSESGCLSCA